MCLEAGIRDLLEHLENRFDPGRPRVQRRVRRSATVGQSFGAEEFAMRDDRLEHLRHDRTLAAVQDVLFLLGQFHLEGIGRVVLFQPSI
jgi:hypothetical protein